MDLFKELIPFLEQRNFDAIANLSDEQLKKLSPLMAMKIMSAVKGRNAEYAMLATNEFVNKDFWKLSDHPKLQLMLAANASTRKLGGNNPNHYFPGKLSKDPIREQLKKWYPTWKDDEVQMMLDIATKEELIELGEKFGLQEKEMKQWKENVGKF